VRGPCDDAQRHHVGGQAGVDHRVSDRPAADQARRLAEEESRSLLAECSSRHRYLLINRCLIIKQGDKSCIWYLCAYSSVNISLGYPGVVAICEVGALSLRIGSAVYQDVP